MKVDYFQAVRMVFVFSFLLNFFPGIRLCNIFYLHISSSGFLSRRQSHKNRY